MQDFEPCAEDHFDNLRDDLLSALGVLPDCSRRSSRRSSGSVCEVRSGELCHSCFGVLVRPVSRLRVQFQIDSLASGGATEIVSVATELRL